VPRTALTLQGIERYLIDNVSGIGKKKAKKIVSTYKFETERVLNEEPEKIKELLSLSDKQLEKIKNSWNKQTEEQNAIKGLAKIGINGRTAINIFKKYGEEAAEKVKENPYQLIYDIKRIGFKIADSIARQMGIAKEDPRRIDAGIVHRLTELTEFGNVCYEMKDFYKEAEATLEVPEELIEPECIKMISKGEIIEESGYLYTKDLYYDEKYVAEYLKAMNTDTLNPDVTEDVMHKTGIDYTDEQQQAIYLSTQKRLMVLTGGPGTGKTTTVKGIIEAHIQLGNDVLCAAPTGRAAKRMQEATGRDAKTIHRLLEFNGEGFSRNRSNLLGDGAKSVLIIDESSMIDISLMCSLLAAIPQNMSLVLVGDIDQLPSVGPGTVLKDLVENSRYAKVKLTKIQRQAEGSDIIKTAHALNKGHMPKCQSGKDVFFYNMTDKEADEILSNILTLAKNALTRYSIMDMQILSPQHTGKLGTDMLNQRLRDIVNPDGEKVSGLLGDFRVGDKVMQIKNSYRLGVYNGDVGIITSYDEENKTMMVDYSGVGVEYDDTTSEDLTLAYACTVHKSQGSEYPVVIMPIVTQHYFMLERNLLYTGVTRAKEYLILCATPKAINCGIRNVNIRHRVSRLALKI
jgi:helicase, putative, RecD/TraA family